ncbi:phage tail protein [Paenibacillus vandeheii]
MAFTQKLPEWNAPGVEPSATQKQIGFQPGMKPPAQWFNWHLNWSYLALQELQEKAVEKSYVDSLAEELREEIGEADIPPASLTVQGKVQLSNKTNGTSEDLAPTEKALGLVMTEAVAAKQLGVEQKALVVAALNSIGVAASTSETWAQLIPKISGVIRATGNATAADLLTGKTASNASGPITGSMANRGAVSQNITAQNGSYTIPAGYHNGLGIIKAVFANLIAANIRSGVNIGGVVGTLNEGPMYATGSALSTSGQSSQPMRGGGYANRYDLIVTGLAFRPNRLIIRTSNTGMAEYTNFTYSKASSASETVSYYFEVTAAGYNGYIFQVNEISQDTPQLCSVGPSHFRLPVNNASTPYTWEAFRV